MLTQLAGILIDGQVYVKRASKKGELVWIATAADLEKLSPEAAYDLVAYRLDIDKKCTRRVH